MGGRTVMPSPEHARLRRTVEARLGHVLDEGKLLRTARALGGASPESPAGWTRLVEMVTNAESHFFREAGAYELLAETLATGHGTGRSMRILSAGCAAGQELYSAIIVAREVLGASAGDACEFWGVDVNPAALERARQARFRTWDLRGLDEARRDRWFAGGRGDELALRDEIRHLARFREGNLLEDWPEDLPHRFDFVFLRNVLVHLSSRARLRILERVGGRLSPGGILALACCESMGARPPGFELRQRGASFHFVRGGGAGTEDPFVPPGAREFPRDEPVPLVPPLPPSKDPRTEGSGHRAPAPTNGDAAPPEAPPAPLVEACLRAFGRAAFAEVVRRCRSLREREERLDAEDEGALWTLEGAAHLAEGELDEALGCLGRATVLSSLSWVAHFQRAEALREAGRSDQAAPLYRRAGRCLRRPDQAPVDLFFLAGFPAERMAEACERRARGCDAPRAVPTDAAPRTSRGRG